MFESKGPRIEFTGATAFVVGIGVLVVVLVVYAMSNAAFVKWGPLELRFYREECHPQEDSGRESGRPKSLSMPPRA